MARKGREMGEKAQKVRTYKTIAEALRAGEAGGYHTKNGRYSTMYAYARAHRAMKRGLFRVLGFN